MSPRVYRIVSTLISTLSLFFGFLYFCAESGKSQSPSDDPHKGASCSDCHELVAKVGGVGFSRDDLNRKCSQCHQYAMLQKSDRGLGFHGDPERPCLDCHSFHRSSTINARGREFVVDDGKKLQPVLCPSCHAANQNINLLSPGHREAAKIYHSDPKFTYGLSPSQTCLLCHSEESRINQELAGIGYIPRFSEHSNHPVGIEIGSQSGGSKMIMRDKIDSRLQLLNDKVECQTCHSLISRQKNLLAGFESTNDLCRGCHLIE